MFLNSKLIYKFVSTSYNRVSLSRNISIMNIKSYPRSLNKIVENKTTKNEVGINEDQNSFNSTLACAKEEEAVNEIEANLFENSDNKYDPPKGGAKAILNKYKIGNQDKKVKEIHKEEYSQKMHKKEYSARVIEDKELGISYTRLDLNHPTFSKLLMAARSRKHRDKNQLILIEGRRLFKEAIECGLQLKTLIFSERDKLALIEEKILKEIMTKGEIYKVPQHDLKIWSTLSTPPGIMALFKRPTNNDLNIQLEMYAEETPQIPVTVICDNIREPNNLGSIIRTAAAIPCSEIVVLKGCCDPWESKALRGGCGGQFRIRIIDDVQWGQYIKELPEKCHFLVSENNLKRIYNSGFINSKPEIYFNINIEKENNHYYVIIGGETHGVSEDIYRSIANNKMNAKCVHIPLANGVESLNATTALSLLLFEIRKKYCN